MHRSLRAAACLAVLAPTLLAAQSDTIAATAVADSLPFRAGQWGAEFSLDNGAVGLGALRFSSRRSAWLLDVAASTSWSVSEYSSSEDREVRGTFVSARTGPRRYRSLGHDAASFAGVGVLGSYSWQSVRQDDTRLTSWQGGVYGELGASYFVTQRLSLGAHATVTAAYSASRAVYDNELLPDEERRERRLHLSVGRVRIVGGLFF